MSKLFTHFIGAQLCITILTADLIEIMIVMTMIIIVVVITIIIDMILFITITGDAGKN